MTQNLFFNLKSWHWSSRVKVATLVKVSTLVKVVCCDLYTGRSHVRLVRQQERVFKALSSRLSFGRLEENFCVARVKIHGKLGFTYASKDRILGCYDLDSANRDRNEGVTDLDWTSLTKSV